MGFGAPGWSLVPPPSSISRARAAALAPPAPGASPEPESSAGIYETFGSSVASPGQGAGPSPESSAAPDRLSVDTGREPDSTSTLPADRWGVIVLASVLLMVGLGLFALRWAARHVRST